MKQVQAFWVDQLLGFWSAMAALVAFINFWQPSTPWLRSGKIYVSPQGSDWNLGHHPQTALRTIQRAADIASPGETIVILPGTYRETLHIRNSGRASQPIIFQAQEPGSVTITNAADPSLIQAWQWQPEGDQIFSTTPPWPVDRVIFQDGTNLYQALRGFNLDKFRTLVQRDNAYSAYFYDSAQNRLYVFLEPGRSTEDLLIPKQLPTQDNFGNSAPVANLWLEASHIQLQDLTFELGIRTGILLWDAQNIRIQDCSFYGASYGIADYSGTDPAVEIIIEHSFYHNYPQYYWFRDWLSWEETYSSGGRSSLIGLHGFGLTIRHNLVSHAGDGLQVSPQFRETFNAANHDLLGAGATIEGNLLFQGTDDAIEFDGPAENVWVHYNLIYDFFTSLGLSPVLSGPVLIEDNFFLHPHHPQRINDPAHFKLLNPWFRPNGNSAQNIIQNIAVLNNVFVGNWLAWWHEAPVKDMRVEHNLLAIQRTMNPALPPGVQQSQNQTIRLPLTGYPDPGNNPQWQVSMETLQASPWSLSKPGPHWLDYDRHPATREIQHTLSPHFFGIYPLPTQP